MKEKHPIKSFFKVDICIEKGLKYISYLATIIALIIAVSATVNIITTKLLTWSVPNVNMWITYLFIGLVFFSVPYVRLTTGLISVDIITNRFPDKLNDIITIVSDLVGFICYGLISRYAYPLLVTNYTHHVTSSTGVGNFPLWPFNLILMIFSGLFALTMLWHIVRLIVYKMHGRRPVNLEQLETGKGGGEE